MPYSKTLSQHTFTFLLHGATHTGSFSEGLGMVYEELYTTDPIEKIQDFCSWLDMEIGGAGPANIEKLWLAFNNQEDPLLSHFIEETKKKMEMINNL